MGFVRWLSLLALLFGAEVALSSTTPVVQELSEDGLVLTEAEAFDSEFMSVRYQKLVGESDTADLDPGYPGGGRNRFQCVIAVVVVAERGFDDRFGAREWCGGFNRGRCSFDERDGRWFGNFRDEFRFRSRGNDYGKVVVALLGEVGRFSFNNRFLHNRFKHSFQFSDCVF